MKFGDKVREARKAKNYDLRTLAGLVGVHFTYLSKVENEKLDFGEYPSEDLIIRLADSLDANAGELLLLAKKIPEPIKQRVLERPEAFLKLASLDDAMLDAVVALVEKLDRREKRQR